MRIFVLFAFTTISVGAIIAPMQVRSMTVQLMNRYTVSGTVGPSLCSPSIGAIWTPSNNTCTVLGATEWDIVAGTTLTNPGNTSTTPLVTLTIQGLIVNNGTFSDYGYAGDALGGGFDNNLNATLTVASSGVFSNDGMCINSGSSVSEGNITLVSGASFIVNGGGSMTNTGTLTSNGGNITIASGGSFTVDGNLTINGGGTTVGGSLNIKNSGTLNVAKNSTLVVTGDGKLTITSNRTVSVNGSSILTVTKNGSVVVGSNSKLTVASNRTVSINDSGTLAIKKNGTIIIGGDSKLTIASNRNVTVSGNLTINSGGAVTLNSGNLISNGTISVNGSTSGSGFNNGTLTIDSGTLINNGTLTDGGNVKITSRGILKNYKLTEITLTRGLVNNGSLYNWYQGIINNKGSIANNAGASVYNYGKIYNYGSIGNMGSIIDECGGLLINGSNGTYTGNQPTQSCTTSLPVFPGSNSFLLLGFTLPSLLLIARRFKRHSK